VSSNQRNQRLPNTIPEDDDGYTLTRYIAGREGMYGPLRFTYRPVSYKKKMALKDYLRGKDNEETLDSMAQAASKQLTQWDAVDHKGQPLLTTWLAIRQLHPIQGELFFDIVLSSISTGDIDPDKKADADGKSWFSPPDEELLETEGKN